MLSNYNSNSRCAQEHFMKKASFSGRGNILPTISEESSIMEGTGFLEDMESILEEVTAIPTAEILQDCMPRPRTCRDLTALISENDRRDLFHQPLPRLGLRQRLESYLEEEMLRAVQNKVSQENSEEGRNYQEAGLVRGKGKFARARSKALLSKQPLKEPIVWVIQPAYNKNGTLRFKFTTDMGACLIMKDEEALESIEIMKKSSGNTFFQVYSIEGGISRIVNPGQITSVMEEMISQAKPDVNEEDIVTTAVESHTKTKRRPFQRLMRSILRRRWKTIVRRQVSIATGQKRKRARLWMVIFPVYFIWKSATRRSRTF